jgi:hypothetical protein
MRAKASSDKNDPDYIAGNGYTGARCWAVARPLPAL